MPPAEVPSYDDYGEYDPSEAVELINGKNSATNFEH